MTVFVTTYHVFHSSHHRHTKAVGIIGTQNSNDIHELYKDYVSFEAELWVYFGAYPWKYKARNISNYLLLLHWMSKDIYGLFKSFPPAL